MERGERMSNGSRIARFACLGATAAMLAWPAIGLAASPPVDLSAANRCDFIGQQSGSACLLPFPDDYYTVRDASTPTGRRVNLTTPRCPPTPSGVHIDAAPTTTRATASAPAQTIVVEVPGPRHAGGAHAHRRGADRPTSPATAERDQPIVVIDAETGKRWPIWAELDANATEPAGTAPADPPGEELRLEGHRYIVALRDLKRADGQHDQGARRASATTATACPSSRRRSTRRRAHIEGIFGTLAARGSRARTSTWPGTSPWPATTTSPAGCSTSATTPSPRSATATSPTARRRATRRPSRSRRSQDFTAAQNPQVARRGQGHGRRCRATSTPGCAPGGRFDARRRAACRARQRQLGRQLRLHHPALRGRRRRRRRRGPRSTGTACSATPPRSAPTPSATSRDTTTSCSARPTRSGCRASDLPNAIDGPQRPLATSRRSPTASSRASSTSSSWAAR